MRQIGKHIYLQTETRGCNHGVVLTSNGAVMIDAPFKPSDALQWRDFIKTK